MIGLDFGKLQSIIDEVNDMTKRFERSAKVVYKAAELADKAADKMLEATERLNDKD